MVAVVLVYFVPVIIIISAIKSIRRQCNAGRRLQVGLPELAVMPVALLPSIALVAWIQTQLTNDLLFGFLLLAPLFLYQVCGILCALAFMQDIVIPRGWGEAMLLISFAWILPIIGVMITFVILAITSGRLNPFF